MGETQTKQGFACPMADDSMNTAWEKAEKAITKGKGEAALKILREADADGKEPTTLRLAGQATWLEAKSRKQSGDIPPCCLTVARIHQKEPS